MRKLPIIKISEIRKNEVSPCPYGLSIPFGCENAGDSVDKMAPLDIMQHATEEEKQSIAAANNHLLRWRGTGKPCKYASKIIDVKDAVDCNWETNTAGQGLETTLEGSPWYYKHFSGIGMDGLYSYPLGYYSDNSIDRGTYYGNYSVESIASTESNELIKETGELPDQQRK